MMEILTIIASSWPIATMVVAIAAAIVVRRSLKQSMDLTDKMNEYNINKAVVVRQRQSNDG